MSELLQIMSGLYWCAKKGLKWRHGLGLDHPLMTIVWVEQRLLPRGPVSHHRTDLIVEWNRQHPQRGAKLLCALAAITLVVGFLMGAALALI
jgi:hypothetical protein